MARGVHLAQAPRAGRRAGHESLRRSTTGLLHKVRYVDELYSLGESRPAIPSKISERGLWGEKRRGTSWRLLDGASTPRVHLVSSVLRRAPCYASVISRPPLF